MANLVRALRRRAAILSWLLASPFAVAAAGQAPQPAPQPGPPLTLEAAVAQARANSQAYLSAVTTAQLAAEDVTQSRAALLPSVNGFGQYIRTQPNGTPSGVFVSNDGPNLYNVWANVHGEIFSPGKWAEYRGAAAASALAKAKADVAARGIVATVVQNYYGLAAAIRKAASAQLSLTEARQFLGITQQLEAAGEAAHSDVIKAQIQVAERERDLSEAELNVLKTRLGLTVLIYPDFRDDVAIVDDLEAPPPLPPLNTINAAANVGNPDLRAAQATVQQETFGRSVARGAVLPDLSVDYFYGINANQFAIYNEEHQRLLGSVAQIQLSVPLWTWGAAQSKLRQAELKIQQAKADLTLTERQLLANQRTFYAEAQTAASQVASLRTSLDLAAESLRLTVLRYQAGEVTVLEVADAQTTLQQARNAYDDGLVRYRVALAALQTLTGTL
jgi:outer membrane protein TolC